MGWTCLIKKIKISGRAVEAVGYNNNNNIHGTGEKKLRGRITRARPSVAYRPVQRYRTAKSEKKGRESERGQGTRSEAAVVFAKHTLTRNAVIVYQ